MSREVAGVWWFNFYRQTCMLGEANGSGEPQVAGRRAQMTFMCKLGTYSSVGFPVFLATLDSILDTGNPLNLARGKRG